MNPRYSKEYRKRVHRFSLIFNENPPPVGGTLRVRFARRLAFL